MWDQPHKSSRSYERQGNSCCAAPRSSSQVLRDYQDTHLSLDYISSPTDSSSDYLNPRRGSNENSPPNYRQRVNWAMDYDYATQTRQTRGGYGFSQPKPGYQPRPSGRPQRTRYPDPDCIAQESQSDDDYIASPEAKRDVRVDRRSSYDDRYSDDSLGNGSPIRRSTLRNYNERRPSDYAPHHENKPTVQKVKAGWGDSDSFTQSHSLNPREHDNFREAKQFLERYTKLHTQATDRSDTESFSPGDSSPANRQDESHKSPSGPQRDDEDYYAPSRDNYRERHHNEICSLRHTNDCSRLPEDEDEDDANQRNHFESHSRNLKPRYNRPGSFYSDTDYQRTTAFSNPPPSRHIAHASDWPGSINSDRKDDTHAITTTTTTYSDIASRPSTPHSDRLSRVPTAVDSEDYSSPPPSVPSPPVYRQQQQRRRQSGSSDYGPIPGSWRSRSSSTSGSAFASERRVRSRSPCASPSRRSIHARHSRRIGAYMSDSDDNGVTEESDYLPSDSDGDDDERISVGGGGRRDGNGVAEGSDYLSSVDGRSDVCARDGWCGRESGEEGGYMSEGVENGVAGGGSYRGRW